MTATAISPIDNRIDAIERYDAGLRAEMQRVADAAISLRALLESAWWKDRAALLAAHREEIQLLAKMPA